MPSEKKLPDLLPFGFAPEVVLTPESILEYQAELIGKRSSGRLAGELEHGQDEKNITLGFVVRAPSLQYAVRLFSCSHLKDLPYPTTVRFRELSGGYENAATESEFRSLIERVFRSAYSFSVFQSLLARVGETANESPGA